jgi:RNA polymerase sigma-70 factor, ECF subfamily
VTETHPPFPASAPPLPPVLVPSPAHGGSGFRRLVQQHERALYAIALRLCGTPSDARDLVQDTFECALRHFDRFQEITDGRPWLLTILRHVFLNQCRIRTRERRCSVSVEEVEERIAVPEVEPPSAWAAFSLEQLHAALEEIPEEFRKVYQLHVFEGLSYEEIAGRLRIAKATVGTRLIRARSKLRTRMTERAGN